METNERARANSLGLSRRALLKATPAALLAGSVPAVAAEAESPVMALFREWPRAERFDCVGHGSLPLRGGVGVDILGVPRHAGRPGDDPPLAGHGHGLR